MAFSKTVTPSWLSCTENAARWSPYSAGLAAWDSFSTNSSSFPSGSASGSGWGCPISGVALSNSIIRTLPSTTGSGEIRGASVRFAARLSSAVMSSIRFSPMARSTSKFMKPPVPA
jgi:hypothetical protein